MRQEVGPLVSVCWGFERGVVGATPSSVLSFKLFEGEIPSYIGPLVWVRGAAVTQVDL